MMTYFEMLEILRGKVLIGEDIATIQQRFNEIADAMERLILERDMAIDDLREMNCETCETCEHKFVRISDEPCKSCRYGWGWDNNWKWGGLQHD